MSSKETFEKYKIELNSHDFERLVPLISDDCNFWHPTGTYKGMAQIRQGFESDWKKITEKKSDFSKADWIIESDSEAACTYTFYYSGIAKNQNIYERVHGTTCFRLEQDHWKIFQEHLSFFPA